MIAQSPPEHSNPCANLRRRLKDAGLAVLAIGVVAVVVNGLAFRTSPSPGTAGLAPLPVPVGIPPPTNAITDRERVQGVERTVEYVKAAGDALAERPAGRQPPAGLVPKPDAAHLLPRAPPAPKVEGPMPIPNRTAPGPKGAGLAGAVSAWLEVKKAQEEADRIVKEQREQEEKQEQQRKGKERFERSVRDVDALLRMKAIGDARKAVEVTITAPDHNGYRSVVIHNPSDVDLTGLTVTARRPADQPSGESQVIGFQTVRDRLEARRSRTVCPTAGFGPLRAGDTVEVSFHSARVRTVTVP